MINRVAKQRTRLTVPQIASQAAQQLILTLIAISKRRVFEK
jgi:hypothetical protein